MTYKLLYYEIKELLQKNFSLNYIKTLIQKTSSQ